MSKDLCSQRAWISVRRNRQNSKPNKYITFMVEPMGWGSWVLLVLNWVVRVGLAEKVKVRYALFGFYFFFVLTSSLTVCQLVSSLTLGVVSMFSLSDFIVYKHQFCFIPMLLHFVFPCNLKTFIFSPLFLLKKL